MKTAKVSIKIPVQNHQEGSGEDGRACCYPGRELTPVRTHPSMLAYPPVHRRLPKDPAHSKLKGPIFLRPTLASRFPTTFICTDGNRLPDASKAYKGVKIPYFLQEPQCNQVSDGFQILKNLGPQVSPG